MRALIALAAPAIAGALLIAGPSEAAPVSVMQPVVAASDVLQVQYGGGGYGGGYERREEYRERRDYDGDRYRRREEWRGDGDDRRRRRRIFCRMHPEACY
jgi:hypothetical protein